MANVRKNYNDHGVKLNFSLRISHLIKQNSREKVDFKTRFITLCKFSEYYPLICRNKYKPIPIKPAQPYPNSYIHSNKTKNNVSISPPVPHPSIMPQPVPQRRNQKDASKSNHSQKSPVGYKIRGVDK